MVESFISNYGSVRNFSPFLDVSLRFHLSLFVPCGLDVGGRYRVCDDGVEPWLLNLRCPVCGVFLLDLNPVGCKRCMAIVEVQTSPITCKSEGEVERGKLLVVCPPRSRHCNCVMWRKAVEFGEKQWEDWL